MFFRVIKSLPYLGNMSAFGNSAYRTNSCTLSALYADYRIKVLGKCGADYRCIATVLSCQGSNVLYSLADLHAASAFNAFSGVTYQCRCTFIKELRGFFPGKGNLLYPHSVCQILQFAVFPPLAELAIALMLA